MREWEFIIINDEASRLKVGYPSKDEKPIPQHVFQADEKIHFNKW